MKQLFLAIAFAFLALTNVLAQGDPAVNSSGFQSAIVAVGQTTVLNIELTNSDFVNGQAIPSGGYQLSISLPATLVYRADPLSVSALTQVSGPSFNNFTYDGVNVFTADLASSQGVGVIARFQLVIRGYIATANPVFSNVEVTPLLFGVINSNNSGNDLLSPSLTVTTVLPLRLQSFTGASNGCSNTLSWKSSEEKNVKSIDIESSEDGTTFRTVGTVAPKNVVGTNNYNYTHEGSTAKVFYRLKISDIDGNSVYSDIVSLNTQCKQPSASIYPNPMNALTDGNVVLKNFTGKITGQLQDMNGKQLATIKLLNGSNTINLGKYAQGTYLLKVTDENQQTQTLKIITYR